jgi:electron transfer flavoprotein alpha/beta subunit
VMTVTQETNTPRRPTLMDAVKAKKKPVIIWQPADLGLADGAIAGRVHVRLIDQTGIVVRRKQQMFAGGDMTAVANQVIDALVADHVVKEG